jgi:hypothetical protein
MASFNVSKTFWPTAGKNWVRLCEFITRHRQTLVSICAIVSPSDVSAVNAAFDAIITSCAVIQRVLGLVEEYDN